MTSKKGASEQSPDQVASGWDRWLQFSGKDHTIKVHTTDREEAIDLIADLISKSHDQVEVSKNG